MIKISLSAMNVLVNMIRKNDGSSVLLYLKSCGCNGFSYKFKILKDCDKIQKLDEKIQLDNSYNLYLCNKSLMYILGTEVNYVEDIMGSRFDFKNTSIESKCGCGTSFNF